MNNVELPPRHKLLQLLIHYLSSSWKARSDCFDALPSLFRNSLMLMKPSPSTSFTLMMSLNSSSLTLSIFKTHFRFYGSTFTLTELRTAWQHSNIPRNWVSHPHFYRLSDNLLNIEHPTVNLDLDDHTLNASLSACCCLLVVAFCRSSTEAEAAPPRGIVELGINLEELFTTRAYSYKCVMCRVTGHYSCGVCTEAVFWGIIRVFNVPLHCFSSTRKKV